LQALELDPCTLAVNLPARDLPTAMATYVTRALAREPWSQVKLIDGLTESIALRSNYEQRLHAERAAVTS
jgi:hypothetical protein